MRDIVVYSTDADVPANLRCVGFFKDGKGYLPVRFNGETEDAVRTAMTKWWAEEAERQSKLRGGQKKPQASPAEPRKTYAIATPPVDGVAEFEALL